MQWLAHLLTRLGFVPRDVVNAPVIQAYLLREGRRPGSPNVTKQARSYFGVSGDATLEEIDEVVDYYPVFRIERIASSTRPQA
jgi:hypothetical protein